MKASLGDRVPSPSGTTLSPIALYRCIGAANGCGYFAGFTFDYAAMFSGGYRYGGYR
jgi:hypothetical protein